MPFCPPDAQWISCHSTYYINHSNECRPCTILALHMMEFHPFPHQSMLLPLMDPNIAQISHTWIAASLIIGHILHSSLAQMFLYRSYTDAHHSSMMRSNPYNIISWKDNTSFTLAPITQHTPIYNDEVSSQQVLQLYLESIPSHQTSIIGRWPNKSNGININPVPQAQRITKIDKSIPPGIIITHQDRKENASTQKNLLNGP